LWGSAGLAAARQPRDIIRSIALVRQVDGAVDLLAAEKSARAGLENPLTHCACELEVFERAIEGTCDLVAAPDVQPDLREPATARLLLEEEHGLAAETAAAEPVLDLDVVDDADRLAGETLSKPDTSYRLIRLRPLDDEQVLPDGWPSFRGEGGEVLFRFYSQPPIWRRGARCRSAERRMKTRGAAFCCRKRIKCWCVAELPACVEGASSGSGGVGFACALGASTAATTSARPSRLISRREPLFFMTPSWVAGIPRR
jgi:hypothetical protein